VNGLTRHYLKQLLVAACLISVSVLSYAPIAEASTATLTARRKAYKPKFFKPHEFATLRVLTETILRDDEMPGVRVVKADEFIDFQITYDPEIQDRFRKGLAWLDRHSRRLHGRNFIELKSAQRKEIIQCLEIKAKHRPGEEKGREFFDLARRYTYMGFYASEEALKIAIPESKSTPTDKKRRLAGSSDGNSD